MSGTSLFFRPAGRRGALGREQAASGSPLAGEAAPPGVIAPPGTQLILDLMFLLSSVLGVLTLAVHAATTRQEQVAGVIVMALLGALWLRLRRDFSDRTVTLGFAGVGLAGLWFPNVVAFVSLLLFVAVLVVALGHGPRAALGLIAVATGILWFTAIPLGRGTDPSIGAEILAIAVFYGVGAGIGTAMRQAELSRGRAERLNAQLLEANSQLEAALVTRGELALAEERARSARELHDGLGHQLTLTGMSLEFAQRVRERDPERAWQEVDAAAARNREALDHMRLWVRALNPPRPLPGMGGAEAFDAIAESFRGTGLDVTVEHHGSEAPLPSEVALLATRLVQEGLTNVLRHAGATSVHILVEQSPQEFRIALSDNGRDDDRVGSQAGGFGLRSLRERAAALGATLETRQGAAGGFELVATVPLGAAAGAAAAPLADTERTQ
ncbi:sensor histidine kinase [Actinomycetota bacterium]